MDRELCVYRALLRLFPGAYRKVHGERLEGLFWDTLGDWRTERGTPGARLWLGVAWDTVRAAAGEWGYSPGRSAVGWRLRTVVPACILLPLRAVIHLPSAKALPMYRFEWMPDAQAVLVRPDGPFDLARSLATLDALDGVRQTGPVVALIWDVRGRIDYPSASEIRTLVSQFDRWERAVVLSRPDVQYTMAQMAAELSERVTAATTISEALAWVRGAAPTRPDWASPRTT